MAQYKYPCRNCADRAPGCHGKCQKYIEAKAIHAEQKRAKKAFDAAEDDYHGFIAESIAAHKKGRK